MNRRISRLDEKLQHYTQLVVESRASGSSSSITDIVAHSDMVRDTHKLKGKPILFLSSSSPWAFPIIWGRPNGIEYHYSTLSCLVRPPLTPRFPYIFYTSLSTWFSVFLSISFLILVHLTFFLVRALGHFSYLFSLFSVMFFVTGATFTDPLKCSFLILTFFVIPHIHRSILVHLQSSFLSMIV